MNAPLPGDFKATSTALAVGMAAALLLLPYCVAAYLPTSIDADIPLESFRVYPLGVSGDRVTIDVTVQSGPNVDFYFLNRSVLDKLNASWPSPEQLDHFGGLSVLNVSSIHETVTIPPDEFLLVIVNRDPIQSTSVTGSIDKATPFPGQVLAVAVILISVGAVIAAVVVVMVRRSFRSRLSPYSPPGRPTPPSLAQQHIQAQRAVVHQELDRACPRCGTENPKGTVMCGNCGVRL